MNRSKTLLVAVIFISLVPMRSSIAFFSTGSATEITQILNNIQLVIQVIEQYKTYYELVKQYKNMIENTEPWEDMHWGRGIDFLDELAGAVAEDRVIAYAGKEIASNMDQVLPGYRRYLDRSINEWTPEVIGQFYDDISEGNRNNAKAALKAANLHHLEFETEEELLEDLKLQVETSAGRHQAMQVANEIAIQGLRQNQKLRQLLMTQIQLQSNFMAYKTEQQSAEWAYRQRLQEDTDRVLRQINTKDGASF